MATPRPRPDPASAGPTERPAIWINGRQRPAFDLRAYGAYSLIATRAALGPAVGNVAGAVSRLGSRVNEGAFAIDTTRLGRAAACLPSRPSVAGAFGATASLLTRTSRVVLPPPSVPESLAAYDALWRARKVPPSGRLRGVDMDEVQDDPDLRALRDTAILRPQRPARAPTTLTVVATAPEPAAVAPTEAPADAQPAPIPASATDLAIRNLLSGLHEPPATAPTPPALPGAIAVAALPDAALPDAAAPMPERKPLPAWTRALAGHAATGTAHLLGWTLIAVAMPVGLVKAGVAHLDGRDLRDLVEDP